MGDIKENNLGLIHVYYGDGKGKTSSAVGTVIRAASSGYKVLISRFLKNDDSAEVPFLANTENITLIPTEKDYGFFFEMNDETKKEAGKYFTAMLIKSFDMCANNSYNLLFLDEINVAVDLGLVKESLLLEKLKNKPKHLEVILTGRNPSNALIKLSDYACEIKNIKHPYDLGINARKGIDY